MKWVESIEPGIDLPGPEGKLDAAGRDAAPTLTAKERIPRRHALSAAPLVRPEPPELGHQSVRPEDVAGPAVLGDLGTQPDSVLGLAIRCVDIADVQAYNLGQPQP